jgi:RimJ/RimL family protein N-acetyltransferase
MSSTNTPSNNIIFIKGKKVILRPVEEADLPFFQLWINREEIRRNLMAFRPMTQGGEREWYEKIQKNENNVQFAICTLEGRLIGSTGIFNINWQHRFGQTGTIIGEEEFRNRGLGYDAKMHLLNYAFNTLNLNKICSGAYEFNEQSLRYSLKCGYQIEGRARKQFFKDGCYYDMIQLGVLREEWQPLWDAYQKEQP